MSRAIPFQPSERVLINDGIGPQSTQVLGCEWLDAAWQVWVEDRRNGGVRCIPATEVLSTLEFLKDVHLTTKH